MFEFSGVLWTYEEPGGWYFITLPKDISDDIHRLFKDISPGFGSMPMNVTIGETKWATSAFYDTKAHAYLLPIKAKVRKAETIGLGDMVTVHIEVVFK